MNLNYIIIPIIAALGCRNTILTQKHEFKLIDRDSMVLGVVSCELPVDFDTSYTWISSSDCMCCEAVMHRSHSSKFDIKMEGGFSGEPHLESGYYFSIAHSTEISCDTSSEYLYSGAQANSDARKRRFELRIKELEERGGTKVIVDTNRMINNLKYNILYFTDKDFYKTEEKDSLAIKTITFNKLTASTKYNNRNINFVIQSNVHQRDSFYAIAMNIIKSVKIE
jgi:hypothetical protein